MSEANGKGLRPHGTPDARLPESLPDGRPWPKISIVTPSFNQGRFLEDTILSVLESGYPNVEHIVVDGGSTDETGDVLARYRDRLAYAVSEKDEGQADAINKGMVRATGQILTWLNSDDTLAPGALHAAALAFHTSNADLVAGVCQLFRDGVLVDQHLTSAPDGPLPLDDLLDLDACWNAGEFFYQPEVLFTRRIWEKAGGHVDKAAHFSMDYELWLRFAEAGARLHVIGRPIARFRMHEGQKTHDPSGFKAELPTVRDAFLAWTGRTREPRENRPKSKLRAVFFNDMGFRYGAGLAHGRLAASMASAGHDVVPIAAAPGSSATNVPLVETAKILETIGAQEPDLVVLGNLHGASLDGGLVGLIAERWPTAAVMHDLWMVTGRCAYSGTCELYRTGCDDRCPTPGEYPALAPQLIRGAFTQKRRVLTSMERPPALLGNSRWTADIARGAFGPGEAPPPVSWIRLTAPTDVFFPRDKRLCRELLEIPRESFVVLFSGTLISDRRKGLEHLFTALSRLDFPDLHLVCVGNVAEDVRARIGDKPVKIMGFVEDPQRLAMIYSAADVFVGPSLEEGFGQVFIEAAACGTPSIGYAVGGVPEAIEDGVTGLVVTPVHPADLAEAIAELHQHPERRETLSRLARLHAENEWSTFAAYHRFVEALGETGLAATLGLSRKTSFPPQPAALPPTRYVEPTLVSWRGLTGFGPWEGPFPEWHLPICRWALGPVATMEVLSPDAGKKRLLVRCRNFHEGQRVRLVHDCKVIGETEIPVCRNDGDHVFDCEIETTAGANRIELDFWRWAQGAGERPMSILISGVGLIPG